MTDTKTIKTVTDTKTIKTVTDTKTIKTVTDTRTEQKDWAISVGSCLSHKPQHPQHEKVTPRGQTNKETGTGGDRFGETRRISLRERTDNK